MANKGTKIKKTKNAQSAFEAWNQNRTPIGEYIPGNERIVPCWKGIDYPKYYVTETGVVLSFANKTPQVLKKHLTSNGYHYVELSDNRKNSKSNRPKIRVHHLVWFSLVYDAIQNNNGIAPVWFFADLYHKFTQEELNQVVIDVSKNILEVHHSDKDRFNNNSKNLIVLPKGLHELLDSLGVRSLEEILELLRNKDIKSYMPKDKYLGFTEDGKAIQIPKKIVHYAWFTNKIEMNLRTHDEVLISEFSNDNKQIQVSRVRMIDGEMIGEHLTPEEQSKIDILSQTFISPDVMEYLYKNHLISL